MLRLQACASMWDVAKGRPTRPGRGAPRDRRFHGLQAACALPSGEGSPVACLSGARGMGRRRDWHAPRVHPVYQRPLACWLRF